MRVLFNISNIGSLCSVLWRLTYDYVTKGVRGKNVTEEAERMVEDLQLQDKKNTPSQKLSGGMKRKLRLSIHCIFSNNFY